MSEPFDVLLQDPGEAELVAALTRASLDDSRPDFAQKRWETQLAEVAAHAEGSMAITTITDRRGRTSHVLLAWWSDLLGGRHVRVRGGSRVNLRTHLSRLDHDERPPLWQVYPERIYRVKRGDAEPVWLASCACGVTGPPREVGWMGPRCGPCHDRREEGDPAAVSEGRTILREGSPVSALAFSPDRETVAAVIHRDLLVEIRRGGEERTLYGDVVEEPRDRGFEIAPLNYSPDHRWLAFGIAVAGQVALLDLRNDRTVCLSLADEYPHHLTAIAFSPRSDHLAACDYERQGRLFRWTGSLWAEVKSFLGATAVAISGDGQRLAVGGSGGAVRLYSTDSGATLGQVISGALSEESVLFLAWTSGDDSLVILTGFEDAPRATQQHLRQWDLLRRREARSAAFGVAGLMAMSPDARYLASIRYDDQHSPSAIHFWDLVAWHEVGWIEWDPEDAIHALAFSPDNETLAIGTHHGRIKLVPWRQLLVG